MIVVLLSVLAMGAVPSQPAGANWWRNSSTGCSPGTLGNSADSASHGYYYDGQLSSAMRSATDWARTNNIDPTDVTSFSVAQVAFDTDVVVYDQDYVTFCGYVWDGTPGTSGGVHALTHCQSLTPNPAGACEKFEVRYDESFTTGSTTNERRSLACHENGHTLGLEHGSGCVVLDSPTTPMEFSIFQKIWINAKY